MQPGVGLGFGGWSQRWEDGIRPKGKPQVTGSEERREGGQCDDGTTLIRGEVGILCQQEVTKTKLGRLLECSSFSQVNVGNEAAV